MAPSIRRTPFTSTVALADSDSIVVLTTVEPSTGTSCSPSGAAAGVPEASTPVRARATICFTGYPLG